MNQLCWHMYWIAITWGVSKGPLVCYLQKLRCSKIVGPSNISGSMPISLVVGAGGRFSSGVGGGG